MRTSELADLAGVTIRALRHYHRIGLLEEPGRAADDDAADDDAATDDAAGDAANEAADDDHEYGVRHLARLLRITRLTELGVPLAVLPDVLDDPDAAADLLDRLDREAAAEIRRLTCRRAVIAVLREHGAVPDLPPGGAPGLPPGGAPVSDDRHVPALHTVEERGRGD
ncbi:MerR family transcriptional regulator [Promicromonospora sp. NPDC090134]|uniref:MerR family transcriptional regulator n=1 Tax=Promicromonospora sp. NPDC090134 TaxID=3364408 RepID=UPI003802EEEE